MRDYELVLIVHPELDDTAFNEVVDKVKGWITDSGGKIEKTDVWGKKRMAYAIRKQLDGQYILLNVKIAPTYTNELDRNLRLLEPVLRFLLTSIEQ